MSVRPRVPYSPFIFPPVVLIGKVHPHYRLPPPTPPQVCSMENPFCPPFPFRPGAVFCPSPFFDCSSYVIDLLEIKVFFFAVCFPLLLLSVISGTGRSFLSTVFPAAHSLPWPQDQFLKDRPRSPGDVYRNKFLFPPPPPFPLRRFFSNNDLIRPGERTGNSLLSSNLRCCFF